MNWSVVSQRDRSNVIPGTGNVLRGNALNQWLLLAQDVTRFSNISYSSDGIVWSKGTIPDTVSTDDQLWNADYSPTQKKYLLIGTKSSSTGAPILLSSTNGKIWREQLNNLLDQYLRNIYWNGTLNQWLTVGNFNILSSTDSGVSWNPALGVNLNEAYLRGIAWSSELGQYLVLGQNGNGQELLYRSNDGVNWTQQLFANFGYLRTAAYSPTKKLWVVVGFSGTILTSTDGAIWTRINWLSNQTNWDLWTVEWNQSLKLWIASGGSSVSQYGGNILIYSADGRNWSVSTNKQPYLTSSLAIKQ